MAKLARPTHSLAPDFKRDTVFKMAVLSFESKLGIMLGVSVLILNRLLLALPSVVEDIGVLLDHLQDDVLEVVLPKN